MDWSLSEYLNLIELRSQTWCLTDMGGSGGFRIPSSEGVLFYAVLAGSTRLSYDAGEAITLGPGDIAIVLSGHAHSVRCHESSVCNVLTFLADGAPVDAPRHFNLGDGPTTCSLLCGRLKARWPGAKRPSEVPALLQTTANQACVDLARLCQMAEGSGGTSILTRMATLIFTTAFRAHPAVDTIYRESGLRAPIAQAIQFIETHPFTEWTVGNLASKVGMGRANFALRFTADVGKTPMTFVTETRMTHAATFLERTELKVAEIGARIGYRSESAFSHRFYKHFGVTPGEMRKRKQRKHSSVRSAAQD